nr:MAG TPA: Gamma-aminobutyric acid receptor subunit alpha-1, PTX, Membrane, Channel, Nanobody [Caudoviricetes sp.]
MQKTGRINFPSGFSICFFLYLWYYSINHD